MQAARLAVFMVGDVVHTFIGRYLKEHPEDEQRVVDALAVTTVTGMVLAALGILVANRLLPEDLPARGDWERYAFWGTWALALLHAGWRSAPVASGLANPAWRIEIVVTAAVRG